MSHLDQALRDVLAIKLNELLGHYGLGRWQPTRLPEASMYLCCILGFTGDQLNGSVIFAATYEAVSDTNLMPAILDCARAHVTMGEMCDTLRDVWGTWRETPVF